MADGSDRIVARTVSSISEINAETWDALANPSDQPFNPFVSYAFLSALEDSKSVAHENGWAPMHLVVEQEQTGGPEISGIAPLYAKGHSQGEYVFDHHWADAYERSGGRYYPKLLSATPFTPVPGPRLFAREDQSKTNLAHALRQITAQIGASSVHVNFINESDKTTLAKAGFLPRLGEQYHWFNRGYDTFDDFLDALASRKRKAIRRERREAAKDVTIKRLVGAEITEHHWNAFWLFYQDTSARKWGQPYLTRTFFRLLSERMPEHLLFIVAERDGEPIAGALNFIGGDTLYGRYWGCNEDTPFLHFELCYHQAVDFAIERGLSCVEAGAQGQHKIARGYEPAPTWSAHWIENDSFRDAIARYLDVERDETGREIEMLKNLRRLKKGSIVSLARHRQARETWKKMP